MIRSRGGSASLRAKAPTFFGAKGAFAVIRRSHDILIVVWAGAGSDDVLDVTDYGIDGSNFASVLGEDLSGNAVLAFNADDKITLLGVDMDSLHFDDFIPI